LGVLRCFGCDSGGCGSGLPWLFGCFEVFRIRWYLVMERWWCLEEWAARVVLGCCRGDGVKLFWMWLRWWVIVMRGGGGFGFLSRLKGRGT
jgi:hypothetical protein